MDKLPEELLAHIFSFFSTCQLSLSNGKTTHSLIHLQLVCKAFLRPAKIALLRIKVNSLIIFFFKKKLN